MSKKEPYTIYSGIPTEVVANAEPLDYGNKSQLKALAIQHFKSKYDCTWYEREGIITILDKPEEYFQEISDQLLEMIRVDTTVHPYILTPEPVDIPMDFLEDLISILRLYYIGDK